MTTGIKRTGLDFQKALIHLFYNPGQRNGGITTLQGRSFSFLSCERIIKKTDQKQSRIGLNYDAMYE